MRLFLIPVLWVLFLAIQSWSYCTYANIATVNRWINESVTPRCTLWVDLKSMGAEAFLDIYFDVISSQVTASDSIEIRSSWRLPKEALVDSMILWINGEPEPAKHISVGQANATYNSIVKVRRDPAILTKQASYYYGYDNDYDLKVFPAFKNQTRHVRIFMHLQGALSSGMKEIDFGTPGSTVLLMMPDSAAKRLPSLNAGDLQQVTVNGKSLLLAENLSTVGTVLNLDPVFSPVFHEGVFGIIDTTRSDTSYVGLTVDLQKALGGGRFASGKRLTFVWVPSSLDSQPYYSYYSYYGYRYYGAYSSSLKEKKALASYVNTLTSADAFNIVYAGQSMKMFEPHMIPASTGLRDKALRFIDSLTLPKTPATRRLTFEALKSAFGSIASSDTPAVVFCMDLEADPYSPYYRYTDYSSMVNAIVAINVNKATFYAYINSSKYAFYQQLAQALNGKICYGWNTAELSSLVDEAFMPVITGTTLRFTSNEVMDGITYQPYYYPSFNDANYSYYNSYRSFKDVSLYGKTLSRTIGVEVSAKIDGTRYTKQFRINDCSSAQSGLAMDKKWAVRMIDYFWTSGNSGRLINPTQGIGELAGLDRYDECVYAEMVDISLKSHVLTCATALLALEPGMQLVDDPLYQDDVTGSGNMTLAMEDDSLKNRELKTGLAASPNPFNPATKITLTQPGLNGMVVLSIYAIDGRLVRNITATAASGRAVFEWNGCDASGLRLASGVYIARATAGRRVLETRLTLMK